MARSCTVCSRADAGTVNRLLGDGRSARSVAREFGLSEDAVQRHARRHVANPANLSPSRGVRREPSEPAGDPLDELVDALRAQALAGNPALVHQYRLALSAQAAIHAASPAMNYIDTAEWIALRTAIFEALQPYPEARIAVADALADR